MNGDQVNPTNPAPTPVAAPAPAVAPANQKPVVVEKIKTANSILVAVSADPSIDQLAAATALTLILEKYNKNATAVFSGKVPSALEFLKPNETFEKNTDSLRDFIIAIDKSKADKLRYKVEDNVVKIFITPYKTSITEKDLQYNAGDFNVDVILALGVQHQQDLDTAITAHGRIFHDAVVVSITNTSGSDLGVAKWEDASASSLSELIANLAIELGQNILDADIATALLTGIVAETGRFSNAKTHPSTMTISSILLQAGADQQLVNQQLQSVISTDVSLQAGTEIRPTITSEELAKELPHEQEELVIGEDGTLSSAGEPAAAPDEAMADKPAEASAPAAQPAASEPAPVAPEPVVPAPESETTATEAPQETPEIQHANADGLQFELAGSGLPEPDLVLPSEPVAPAPEPAPQAADPAEDPDDAEAARKAISDALKNAAAESDIIPAINVVEAPAPDSVPPISAEPAPLAASPADQPFTMPLPPSSALTQAPPIVMPAADPTADGPTGPAVPPPLPPPLPPTPQA